jgi:hypothetical protein
MLDIADRILPGLVKDGIDMKQSNNQLDSGIDAQIVYFRKMQ